MDHEHFHYELVALSSQSSEQKPSDIHIRSTENYQNNIVQSTLSCEFSDWALAVAFFVVLLGLKFLSSSLLSTMGE